MTEDLFAIALRISIMYLYILALLRLTGKRSIGSLSAFDFVVTTIIGDMFDDVFWSEVPVSQGLVGFSVILFLHFLVGYGSYRSKTFNALVSSVPTLVIKQSRFVQDGLRKERTPESDIYSDLRIQSEENLTEIRESYLEPSGELSVLRKEKFKIAQKQDLPRLKSLVK